MDKKFDILNYSGKWNKTPKFSLLNLSIVPTNFAILCQSCWQKILALRAHFYYDPWSKPQSTKPHDNAHTHAIPPPIHYYFITVVLSTRFLFPRDHDLYLIHDRHFGIQISRYRHNQHWENDITQELNIENKAVSLTEYINVSSYSGVQHLSSEFANFDFPQNTTPFEAGCICE